MSLWVALLLAASPLEFDVDGRVSAEVRDAQGRVLWKGDATAGTLVPDACVDGGELRIATSAAGKRAVQRATFRAPSSTRRCLARVRNGTPAELDVIVFAGVPDDLEVTLSDADDATGMGVFTIHNHALRQYVIVNVSVATFGSVSAADCDSDLAMVATEATTRVEIEQRVCARPLNPGRYERTLWLTHDGETIIELKFPFFAKPRAVPSVLFPDSEFSALRLEELGPRLVAPNGRSACVCEGELVGRTPHRMERLGHKRVLCGMPPGGSVADCEVPSVRMPWNAGDFPPHLPRVEP